MKGCSKRHLRRLFKKEKYVFSRKLSLCNEPESEAACSSGNVLCQNNDQVENNLSNCNIVEEE